MDPTDALPLPRHERYVRRRLLGRGGFGEVWLADDLELNRPVAVKYLTSLTPEDLSRFRREARLAAKLSHPNIVPIHDVGDRFLVMEFIDGGPAHHASPSPRDAADWIRQAAEGVAHAHAQGVIHRDLKPANLLVAGGKAYVADFGLAKQVGADSSVSMTGDVFGTPMFMSPEQARGATAEIGPHSDIYSLGASLYTLLAGRPPFPSGDAYEILRKVVEQEPAPLDAAIDRDLRVIVQKAMEKDSARRYGTAEAMAADLRRYLDGDPISARPASVAYRLRKRVRRNPFAWIGMTAAVGLVAALAHQAWTSHRREQALLKYQEAQSDFHAALTAVLGGDESADALMRRFEEKLAEAKRIDPGFDAGWFERAQFRRLSGDEAGAIEALREGLARDPDNPIGRVERGMLLAARYQRKWDETNATLTLARSMREAPVDDPEILDPRLAEQRRESLALLEAASLEGERPWVRLARSEIRLLARDLDGAEREIEGLHYAHAKVLRGRIAAARDREDLALQAYADAITTQPNHWPAHEQRGRLLAHMSNAARERGDPAAREMAEASLQHWDSMPDPVIARLGRAFAHWVLGCIAVDGGVDPTAHFEGVIAEADAALVLDPSNVHAWMNLGEAHSQLMQWALDRGGDPLPHAERAVAAYDRALAIDDRHVDIALNRGSKFLLLGRWRSARGEDPSEPFRRATDAFEGALKSHAGDAPSLVMLSVVRGEEADWAAARGEDPRALYDAAVRHARAADAARPLAVELTRRACWKQGCGVDANADFDEAEREFARAIAADPRDVYALRGRGMLWVIRAEAGDPVAAARRAVESLEASLKINPNDVEALVHRGKALRLIGDEGLPEGIRSLEAALSLNPALAEAWNDLGLIHQQWAARLDDPVERYALAIDAYDRAIDINPRMAWALINKGAALQQRAIWEAYHAGDAGATLREAVETIDRATAMSPRFASAHNNRGNIYQNLGRWQRTNGADPAGAFEQAIASYGRALELNPRMWEAYANRGALHEGAGRLREALSDYESALAINPGLREWVEAARRRLADF